MLVGENAVLPYLFYQILDVFILDIRNFAFVVNCQEYNTQTIFTDLNIKSQNSCTSAFPLSLGRYGHTYLSYAITQIVSD